MSHHVEENNQFRSTFGDAGYCILQLLDSLASQPAMLLANPRLAAAMDSLGESDEVTH